MQRLRGESPTVQGFINSMNFNALNAARSEAFENASKKQPFNSELALRKHLKSYMEALFMNRVPQNGNYNTEIKPMENQIKPVLESYLGELTESEKSLIRRPASPAPSNSGSTGSTSSSGLNRVISWGSTTSNNVAPVIKGGHRRSTKRTKRTKRRTTKRRT